MRGPLYALVLAGGAGRRFGGDKLLASLGGSPLLHRAVNAALAAPAAQVYVVVGHDEARISAAALQAAQRAGGADRLNIVYAEDHAEGMGASLRAGVAALPPHAGGVFVFLGDMPSIPHGLAERLSEALGEAPAAFPVHKGRRGHPALFAARLFPELRLSRGDQGAKALLDRLGSSAVQLETDSSGIFTDIDRPEDLASLAGLMKRPGPIT